MPKRTVDLGARQALLDIVSFGRRGPGRRDSITAAQRDQIARIVRRTPEVMIKVSGGGRSLKAIKNHVEYIGREGELELETDEGDSLKGDKVAQQLIEDWDLDLVSHRRQAAVAVTNARKPPRLVHNIIFSMPAGTPPDKLFAAVRKFAQEEFALQHRYAMALHTDQKHPHVHVVVKAMSEEGVRLNIRKPTLREWRQEFARHLREHGIEANATDRAVRGSITNRKPDGIYRAIRRGESTHMRERIQSVHSDLLKGNIRVEPAKTKLLNTRAQVECGWRAVRDLLEYQGKSDLAGDVRGFVDRMPPPRTERERISEQLQKQRRSEYVYEKVPPADVPGAQSR
jgi:Relaxase/Mobilisation nuclease domain